MGMRDYLAPDCAPGLVELAERVNRPDDQQAGISPQRRPGQSAEDWRTNQTGALLKKMAGLQLFARDRKFLSTGPFVPWRCTGERHRVDYPGHHTPSSPPKQSSST